MAEGGELPAVRACVAPSRNFTPRKQSGEVGSAVFTRVALPILIGLASAIATLGTRVFSNGFLQEPAEVKVASVVLAATVVANAVLAAKNGYSAVREKAIGDAYVTLLAALTKIVGSTQIPHGDIGLSAYRVSRKLRSPLCLRWWPLRLPWCQVQQRIARVRLSNNPPRCTIEWVDGKGVVGECWRVKDREAMFVRRDSTYLNCNEDAWASAPAATSMGLSYEEWITTQRYALILARPVHVGERYVGCVSLDTSKDAHVDKLLAEQSREFLGDAAAAVGKSFGGS